MDQQLCMASISARMASLDGVELFSAPLTARMPVLQVTGCTPPRRKNPGLTIHIILTLVVWGRGPKIQATEAMRTSPLQEVPSQEAFCNEMIGITSIADAGTFLFNHPSSQICC